MAFSLVEQGAEWASTAPVHFSDARVVGADPATVFATLADHAGWPTWFQGMTKAVADGSGEGVGATRAVWVGPVKVNERFVAWEPGSRFAFCVTTTAIPGLRSMVEVLDLSPSGSAATTVRYTVGAEGAGPSFLDGGLRLFAKRIVTTGLKGLAAHHA